MYHRLLLLATILLLFSCKKKTGCDIPEEIERIPVSVEIERLEKPFFAADSKQDIASFLDSNPVFAQRFLQRKNYPSDSAIVNALYNLATNPELQKLAQEADTTFGDMATEKQQLETAFKHIKYYYPEFKEPQVKTYVSGLNQDLFVSDSLLVFGIDFFIGKDASYRPDTYDYILKRYERPNMVPAAMLLLSNRYNKTKFLERSLLAEMVNTGKAYYFVKSIMPCAPDSTIIGYSGQQLADVRHNEGRIWAHFVEQKLLYEKSPFVVNKYIGERPNTPEIDATSPGRLGTWVGWQIVRRYMERNPKVTLQELMADDDHQKIFNESKYKPEKR
ncbi:gliding motility lipoprotein GldB [Pontibacter virosus]|uniref:Gliding motility-associated lipoprotein GldB n=1 Tax=Pontibacter virosus TaxID=1765052 RepID=A0A2U1AS27_9BACT|nr:gliding motility lipoprotein GldB [Pontibacter virosus]PVY39244.1 gliding motility-associated lipoprotein GldB [Pontibacter virosus]